ncbi:hypothetical protein ABPG75_007376 [Micractinium tetrahymenae]
MSEPPSPRAGPHAGPTLQPSACPGPAANPAAQLCSSLCLGLSLWECEEALEQCGGDTGEAHRLLRSRQACKLAARCTFDREAQHAQCRRFIEDKRAEQRRRLAEIECEQQELVQRLAAADECGDGAAVARFQAELDRLAGQAAAVPFGACTAIHNKVNEHSFGFESVDLHGQHREHALDVVRHVVRLNTVERPTYRRGTFLVFFITGRGTHSGPSGPVLRPAVLRELERAGVEHELVEPGTVCATFRADADAMHSDVEVASVGLAPRSHRRSPPGR